MSNYRWCGVPQCTNTTLRTPGKLFVHVPVKPEIRTKWLKLARRNADHLSPRSKMHFCEDHFDLEKDMLNYMEFSMTGSVKRKRLRDGCLPSKFECQGRDSSKGKPRSAVAKRQKIATSQECDRILEEYRINEEKAQMSTVTGGNESDMKQNKNSRKREISSDSSSTDEKMKQAAISSEQETPTPVVIKVEPQTDADPVLSESATPAQYVLKGKRFVNVGYLIKSLQKLNDHGRTGCNFSDMDICGETKEGWNIGVQLSCRVCFISAVVWMEDPDTKLIKTRPNVSQTDITPLTQPPISPKIPLKTSKPHPRRTPTPPPDNSMTQFLVPLPLASSVFLPQSKEVPKAKATKQYLRKLPILNPTQAATFINQEIIQGGCSSTSAQSLSSTEPASVQLLFFVDQPESSQMQNPSTATSSVESITVVPDVFVGSQNRSSTSLGTSTTSENITITPDMCAADVLPVDLNLVKKEVEDEPESGHQSMDVDNKTGICLVPMSETSLDPSHVVFDSDDSKLLTSTETPKASSSASDIKISSRTLTTALHPQELSPLTVSELQQLKFSQLPLLEKVTVKKRGRPIPKIQISQPGMSNNKKYMRSFNFEYYRQLNWLCGCEVRNVLFCFPCLLFGGDKLWTEDGFDNLTRLKYKTDKHEKSMKHIDNVVSLTLLGTVRTKEKLSEAYRLSITQHNIKVKKNHKILSKILDCIFFCGNFETPLRGHDENDDSVNPGVFRGLVNFAFKLDSDLKNHLETSAVFKGVSKTIQNEILDCMLQIYQEEILAEIKKASFVAVMVDDVTDVSEDTQMALVLRYVLDGEIFERFWGFFIAENRTADGISKSILEQLDMILLGNGQKLIAQTFDGANFVKGKKAEIQEKIRAVYCNAHFSHCYAHQLNLIMRNAASIVPNSRIFFSNILAIPTFFSRSPKRVSILMKHMELLNPCLSSTKWNFDIWTINNVYENLQPLKNCLAEIQSTSSGDQTIAEATGILKYLKDDNFMFWLKFFHYIMPHLEVLYDQMQSCDISAFEANEYIRNFETAILLLRNSNYCENPSKALIAEAKEVCDCICVDIKDRYSSIKHLVAAKLFNKKYFAKFIVKHPTKEIEQTIKAYPMIDKEKFENELKVFYSRSYIHEFDNLIELLNIILENNLDEAFSEITKLVKILLTVPMTTSEAGRCFSTVKRIKSFLRSTQSSERLNALAVISVEKDFLSCHPKIKEKVIDLFSQIETRRSDFIFK